MCCARTAALLGGDEKQKVNASRDFLQQSLHHVQKSFASYAKNAFCSCVGHASKPIKQCKTVVLLEEEHFCDMCLLTLKIHDKSGFEGPKTCPEPFKIESGATQKPKKTTNMREKSARIAQEPATTEKKTPQSEKCANTAPT